MNVVICTQSTQTKKTFVNALFPFGITLYHAGTHEKLTDKIQHLSPEILILDAANGRFTESFSTISKIREYPAEGVRNVGVILFIDAIEKQTITTFIQMGVIGFIKNDSAEDFIYQYLMKTYQKIHGHLPQRVFVRVNIDPSDPVTVKFQLPNSLSIIAKLRDISLGGMAVELSNSFFPDSLKPGSEIKNIHFILDGKEIEVDGILVSSCNNFSSLKFNNISHEAREHICQFVFKNVSTLS